MPDSANAPLPVVVLISGRGSNLQSIINCTRTGKLPIEIRAVISNRPAAPGLQHATAAGIPTAIVDHTEFSGRADFDLALQACIDAYQPALVVLAGFMRILTPGFVHHYRGRMLNIHPSLLPDYPGLDTHRRVLEAGAGEHGASVHFVTADTDGGPVVAQVRVPVKQGDTPESLGARVLAQEHHLFPLAILWYAQGRIRMDVDGQVRFDGETLLKPRDMAGENALPC